MGVFKWLRRERVTTVTSRRNVSPDAPIYEESTPRTPNNTGTIRTEEYKRDLAEFQARRSSGNKDILETPARKSRCGRHSLPVSCTNCTSNSPDKTFNCEKKSAAKYKKHKSYKRSQSFTEEKASGDVPNIQFLFQNQVFMPGNVFPTSYSVPQNCKRQGRYRSHARRSPDEFLTQKQIDFREDEELTSPPLFYKNNSLPYDAKNFLEGSIKDHNKSSSIDAGKCASETCNSSQSDDVDGPNESSEEKLLEVMSELNNFDRWADEQLKTQSLNSSRSEEHKSNSSVYGLPIVDLSKLDLSIDKRTSWNIGQWGVVPVQIKKLSDVNMDHVKMKQNIEIEILKKYRHPNIILLMGLYPDIHNTVHLICELCLDTLFDIIHEQGHIVSAQTSVNYVTDISSALVFLHMQGYIHTELNSASIMVTGHGSAKLADLATCVKYVDDKVKKERKNYEIYSPEPQYVNIEEVRNVSPINAIDCEPLISQNPSEAYLNTNAVAKDHDVYKGSKHYRWHAPEIFEPDAMGKVYPCSKSDVYSLSLILWECCNAAVPWKTLSYEKLKELYLFWKSGIRLPQDGTYPGCLLDVLQNGLKLNRSDRIDLKYMAERLQVVKRNLADFEDIIIPVRLSKKKKNLISAIWETHSPSDSDGQSPMRQNTRHEAVVHKSLDNTTESEMECNKSRDTALDENVRTHNTPTSAEAEKLYINESDSDGDGNMPRLALDYNKLLDKDFSSACSTPICKAKVRIMNVGTPGSKLQRSDSTEYCSIMSPDTRMSLFIANDESVVNRNSSEKQTTAQLSKSFTPQSYRPLHIKVPNVANMDSIKSLSRDQNSPNRTSTYNFDIKNYSLPTTPIARSNKLRKNAWLSGEFNGNDKRKEDKNDSLPESTPEKDSKSLLSVPRSPSISSEDRALFKNNDNVSSTKEHSSSPECDRTGRNDISTDKKIGQRREWGARPWSSKPALERGAAAKPRAAEDGLARVNVKPLVAIHEKWIYEANKKTGRSMSLPEENRCQIPAVKPASHCVSTLQQSLPQLNSKRSHTNKFYRSHSTSSSSKSGGQSEQFGHVRDIISKAMIFSAKDPPLAENKSDKSNITKCYSTLTKEYSGSESKIDQGTDTVGIEEFIKDLIRKEFNHLIQELYDDTSSDYENKNDDIVNKGASNVLEALKLSQRSDQTLKANESIKSFSRIQINGNNRPLLQITFTRNGENSLQVLDNCVNVTICDNSSGKAEKLSQSIEETLTAEEFHTHSLKRCQAFNAIQEARSTEDLYIDDDLSTHMQENFGGKVKLIPLHGSLHEILCEKEDDCCLIKVKQENGCDTIYFKCDNSDTESRDAIDGPQSDDLTQDTVVFKRSISLIEERIQRIVPKERRPCTPSRKGNLTKDSDAKAPLRTRPKSEIYVQNISKETKLLSNSSPSLTINETERFDEVEVNLESALCYQDSSSDECLKCRVDSDEFETLEKEIEEDVVNNTLCSNASSYGCGCLEKISEENLSIINDDVNEKDNCSIESNQEIFN